MTSVATRQGARGAAGASPSAPAPAYPVAARAALAVTLVARSAAGLVARAARAAGLAARAAGLVARAARAAGLAARAAGLVARAARAAGEAPAKTPAARSTVGLAALAALALTLAAPRAEAGPETTLREFGSAQIKKGVRSIGMGGDGATWGNYALVYRDAGTAIVDYGRVHFTDTGDDFSFTAVGFASPTFWDGSALYVIAMSQHADGVHTWTLTPPNANKPPSLGDGSNEAVFVKFAKPLSAQVAVGVLLSYETSQMTLVPDDGSPTIRFHTAWRPSGGAGISWQPRPWVLLGGRVILNHDEETRATAATVKTGLLRSYEYRAGAAVMPWAGGILDAGVVVLDRANGLEGTSKRRAAPVLGAEQALLPRRLWLRAGYGETSWSAGTSVRVAAFKIDVAYLHDLGAARTDDIFGRTNDALLGTLIFEYEPAGPSPHAPLPPPHAPLPPPAAPPPPR